MTPPKRSVFQAHIEQEMERLEAAHAAVEAGLEESRQLLHGHKSKLDELQTPPPLVMPGFSGRRAHRPSDLLHFSKVSAANERIVPGWIQDSKVDMDVVRFAKYVEYILRGMEYYQEKFGESDRKVTFQELLNVLKTDPNFKPHAHPFINLPSNLAAPSSWDPYRPARDYFPRRFLAEQEEDMYQQQWNGEKSVMVKLKRDPSGAVPLGPRASFPRLRPGTSFPQLRSAQSNYEIRRMTMHDYAPVRLESGAFIPVTPRQFHEERTFAPRNLPPRQEPALSSHNAANPFHFIAMPPGHKAPPGARVINLMGKMASTTLHGLSASLPAGPKISQKQKQKKKKMPKGGKHI